ncbi:MAG: hypothetical protein M3O25_03595, partial [Actinomycetota bacterium]|nr:hypothetical protein [Actinomycetota bacterium]
MPQLVRCASEKSPPPLSSFSQSAATRAGEPETTTDQEILEALAPEHDERLDGDISRAQAAHT